MGKLMQKEEFIELFIASLKKRNFGTTGKLDKYEPVVRTGVSRQETIEIVKEVCSRDELVINEDNLAIELKAVPFHTANDVYHMLLKFEFNKKRIRTNAICFGISLLCCVGGFYYLTKVNPFYSILISSIGSGLVTFVWDNKENPGMVPGSDM